MAVKADSKVTQLDLFINEDRERERIAQDEFKKMVTRSIKGLYARYNELEAAFLALQDTIEKILEEKNP